MSPYLRAIVVASILSNAFPASAQFIDSPTLTIPHVHHVPVIEDFVRVQEIPGAHAAGMVMVDALIQRTPDDGKPASQQTRVYIGYDTDNLYAAFVCFDEDPTAVRGQLAPREHIADDDDTVALHLDTFGDRKHAVAFQVSAAGVQRDGSWTESEAAWDFSYDAIWHAESVRTRHGYVVLMTVPLASLRFPSPPGVAWGVFFFREIPRKNELVFWPAYSPRIAGRLPQAARAVGVRSASAAHGLQITPYLTAHAAEGNKPVHPEAGLDAKWVVRNRYTVDFALNPDFSQVETDEPLVMVNERFEKLFPEKRPFFLENASYFATPMRLLFTRRVVAPQVGVRLTGREGPYAVAALVVDDEATTGTHSARAVVAVARGTRNLGRDGFIGGFISTRNRDAETNRVVGVDGRLALGNNWTSSWQAVASATVQDDKLEAAGPAHTAVVTRSGRSLTYSATWHDRAAGFRADAGFLPRTDFRSIDQKVTYRFRPAGPRLVALGPEMEMTRVWSREGMRLDSALTSRVVFEWRGPATLGIFHAIAQQRLRPQEVHAVSEPVEMDADRTGAEFIFSGARRFGWSMSLARGAGVNLRPIAGQPPHAATNLEATATASGRIGRAFTVDATLLRRHLSDAVTTTAILRNDIWRLKATYQFTADLGVRVIVQDDLLETSRVLTSLSEYRNSTTDLLLTYMTSSGRALFVGATRRDDRNPLSATTTGWQVFTKLSCALQL